MKLLQSTSLFLFLGVSQAWVLQLFDKTGDVTNIYYRSYGPGNTAVGCTSVGTGGNKAESMIWDGSSGPQWLCTVYLYDDVNCGGSALGSFEASVDRDITPANRNKISAYKVTCR